MKAKRPLSLLVVLYLAFFVSLFLTYSEFPERVATHFVAGGTADGWMSRAGHLWFMVGLSIGLPGVVLGLCYAIRFFPSEMLNLPNKEHWMAPERRTETFAFIFAHSIWFGCLAVAFVTAIHFALLEANRAVPPGLSERTILFVGGGFVLGVLFWALTLLRPFCKAPKESGRLLQTI